MGIALGIVFSAATIRHLRSRVKELRAGYERPSILRSVTRFFFVTTQFFVLVWVCTSYGIAIYSTVWLGQVYTMSEPAIQTILGEGFLKVLGNGFRAVCQGGREQEAVPDHEGKNVTGRPYDFFYYVTPAFRTRLPPT